MQFTIPQLQFLRSLVKTGFEFTLLPHMLRRCAATDADWAALQAAGLVAVSAGRCVLTDLGRAEYRRQKVGRWF